MRKLKVPLERRLTALEEIAKGKSPYDVAKELKVTPQAVYRWIGTSKAVSSPESGDLARRVERVERDLDFIKEDLALIKKMLGRRVK
jgi:predicted transcriptional regulator